MAIPKCCLDNGRCSDDRLISESVFSCDSGLGLMIGLMISAANGDRELHYICPLLRLLILIIIGAS